MKRLLVCLLGLAGMAAEAGPVQPIASDVTIDKFRSLSPDNQRLAGVLATRIRANNEGFLERADADQLLAAYARNSKNQQAGEAPGRYLQAAANAYDYRQDAAIRKVMDRVVNGLADAQEKDGYLGVATAAQRGTSSDLQAQRATMAGLLAYYEATGEERAYFTAQKMGDYLVELFRSTKLSLPKDDDADFHLAAAGLTDPLIELYRYTAEPAYVTVAKSIFQRTGLGAKDFSNALQQASASEQTLWLHAFAGMAELYRVSGEAAYLASATLGWETLHRSAEALSTTNCFAAAWLRLSLLLFNITGQEQFGGELENVIYNQLMASQNASNGDVCAELPASGKKPFLSRASAITSNCALAESFGLSLIPQAIWGRWSTGIAVNLYAAGRGTFQLRRRALVQVYSEAAYPENGEILLHIEPSRRVRFPLRLRVPEWAESFSVDYAGSHLLGKPGQALVISRQWQRGDTVKVSIAMQTEVVAGRGVNSTRVALRRGPAILALERSLNPQIRTPGQLAMTSKPKVEALDNQMPRNWAGDEVYRVTGLNAQQPVLLSMVPFADALDFVSWFEKASPTTP